MTLSHADTLAEIATQDPNIEPGQRWSVREEDGTPVRVLRILARHPDADAGGEARWVYEDEPGTRLGFRGTGILPEYNLRRIFRPDAMGA
jgi:hypothetical protein